MRPAYGAKEIGIGGHLVTIVVDVANVMGSRPDGWWRDRAGAAVRLHTQIVRLAASGRAIPPDDPRRPADTRPPGEAGGPAEAGSPGGARTPDDAERPGFVMVLEGAANAAVARMALAEPAPVVGNTVVGSTGRTGGAGPTGGAPRALGPVRSGEVRVVQARGSGDDAIVAVVRELPGRRVVVTADRELRARCVASGAEILGPGWLLGLLRD